MDVIICVPLSLRRDPRTEFTAEVVATQCKMLNVTLKQDTVDPPRAQGVLERLREQLDEKLCRRLGLPLEKGSIGAHHHWH